MAVQPDTIISSARSQPAVRYGFDHAGRRIVERHGDGRVVRYRWNGRDQLVAITTIFSDGRSRHRRIDHDPLGRPGLVDGRVVVVWARSEPRSPLAIGPPRALRLERVADPVADGGPVSWVGERDVGITEKGLAIGGRGALIIDGVEYRGARVYDPSSGSYLTVVPSSPGRCEGLPARSPAPRCRRQTGHRTRPDRWW